MTGRWTVLGRAQRALKALHARGSEWEHPGVKKRSHFRLCVPVSVLRAQLRGGFDEVS